MPDYSDDALLSAIERFKKGEETQGDRKIIGQAIASGQIEIIPSRDSKVIRQSGGTNFGEENEIRVSGTVIGTQTISGVTGDQIIEILKLNEKREDSDTKGILAIIGVIGIIAIAVIAIIVVILVLKPQGAMQLSGEESPVTSTPETKPIQRPTQPPTSTIKPSETIEQAPIITTATNTPSINDLITPTHTTTIMTPEITPTEITPTDTNSPTSNNCENQRNILIHAFITERVNEAIKPQKQVAPPASTLTPNPPPEQWTDSTRKAVVAHFDEYKQSFPISEIKNVVIDRQSIKSKEGDIGEICSITFDVRFYIETQYKCGDEWVDSENLEIKSIRSKAIVEDRYYSPGNSTRQINSVKLYFDNDISNLCPK